jgi:hypothetical protein
MTPGSTPSIQSLQAEVTQLQKENKTYRQRIVDIEAQNSRQQSEIDYLLTQVKPRP